MSTETQHKTKNIHIRVTPLQKTYAESLASAMGLSISSMMVTVMVDAARARGVSDGRSSPAATAPRRTRDLPLVGQ